MGKKSKRKKKREKFLKAQRKKKSPAVYTVLVIAGMVTLAAAIVGIIFVLSSSNRGGGGGDTTSNSSNQGKTIKMTDISATVEGGKIIIPLSEVKKNKLVSFQYTGTKQVPLLAYVSDGDKIVAAVSMCEPCKSESFHIDGDTLVCDACGTVWTLNDHQGISGGCKEYPPDILDSVTVGGDKVLIDEAEVQSWKPRD